MRWTPPWPWALRWPWALPTAGNIGGGGFMVVHDAKSGKNIALDFREVGSKATRDMYVGADGKVIDGKSLYTHYAVGVPGTVAGMEHALKKWGSLPLSTVIAPAAKLADKGFTVSETRAKILEQGRTGPVAATQAIFWRKGEPLGRGDRLVKKDLAQSLRLIASRAPRCSTKAPSPARSRPRWRRMQAPSRCRPSRVTRSPSASHCAAPTAATRS
ncbi:Inactive glutathione hydrolase 2 [Manis javanica]|nr:Inactive glutathione hydrolase 2 [Manis javanica]